MAKKIRTHWELYQDITLFVLQEVPEDTKESAIELYHRWRQHSRVTLTDPSLAAFVLDFFESQKHCRRDILEEAAVIDGFITKKQSTMEEKV